MGLGILPPILAAPSGQQDPSSDVTPSERTSLTIWSKVTTQTQPTMHLGTVCYYNIPQPVLTDTVVLMKLVE